MNKLKLLTISDIPTEEVRWLWYPYLPRGKITIIQGDPGEGKTTYVLALAALGIGTAYGLLRWTGIVVFPSDHTWSADFFDASWRDDGVQFLVLCGGPFAGISAALLGKRKKSGSSQIEEKM